MSEFFNLKLEFLRGVGLARAELFKSELGASTVGDLLGIFPFRYEDRSDVNLIKDCRSGDYVQVIGTLISVEKHKVSKGPKLTGILKDPSGMMQLTWFQGAAWLGESLKLNHEYLVYGKVSTYKGMKTISHPEMDNPQGIESTHGLRPVYSSTEKLNSKGLGIRARRKIIALILERLTPTDVVEVLPKRILDLLRLPRLYDAYKWIHFPEDEGQKSAAINRLKFDELFYMQLRILQAKKLRELKLKGIVFDKVGDLTNRFYKEKLAFDFTGAQKRVIKEIRADMGNGGQMNRLLQGDVGSGKTVVALMCMLIAIDNGYQATLLAPTEILAQQHFNSIQDQLKGLGVQVAFLSGSIKGKVRAAILDHLAHGNIHILIGTHAILEDPVIFKNLGLAITDEQHRFGVVQRAKLWFKNQEIPPHILVMTATPIPRTLAMTSYGDLDVSIIDELPPGRQAIKTLHRVEAHRTQVVSFMKEEIAKGRQIYVVYPLIEESAALDYQNLQDGYEELLNYFPIEQYKIAVVHGRMKPQDKEFEMQRFVRGTAQIMVATTVIEVGVNVPNASIMIIENAERFGLSQLHQLRGRVGRGSDQSYCILMTKMELSSNARTRIKTMCETNDGFKIAEVDMDLRGPGDIEGTQQSGVVELKISDLSKDQAILKAARHFALEILSDDPELQRSENVLIKNHFYRLKSINQSWGRIS